ncbi:MAG: prephenate dehydrogenase/arogenate dehydrogenase family protein [Verrucomicrobia bacterium]|nr:prephenate dehydrogenase/arogenate dehydrogenase family protein [Verrucomicrobiota bacterium]
MHWEKVTLVGAGLLGGSLGLALRQRRLARRVAAYVRRAASAGECRELGVADEVGLDLHAAVAGSDLVVLCTPLAEIPPLATALRPALKPGALVTDVGSAKAAVVRDLEAPLAQAGAHFVGSHPLAGLEKSGVRAARADLFQDAMCVVTPTARSHPGAVRRLKEFWQSVGGKPLEMAAELHDALVARSSHLPHFLAAALAHSVLDPARHPAQALVCASGFRDMTRLASGSVEMWRDIARANADHLREALDGFIAELRRLRQILDAPGDDALQAFLETAKERRDGWCAAGASSPSEELPTPSRHAASRVD